MKKIIRDNPRAVISYEANELINKIKRDIEVIDNDEFIQEVQNIRKKLIEFEPCLKRSGNEKRRSIITCKIKIH